jgi:hypothetical protein
VFVGELVSAPATVSETVALLDAAPWLSVALNVKVSGPE